MITYAKLANTSLKLKRKYQTLTARKHAPSAKTKIVKDKLAKVPASPSKGLAGRGMVMETIKQGYGLYKGYTVSTLGLIRNRNGRIFNVSKGTVTAILMNKTRRHLR
jgi:hypothetical protein